MFKKFWDKRRKTNPGEPKYISLCHILEGSGEDADVIANIFDTYMVEGEDYDAPEKDQMVDYLFTISEDDPS